LLRVLDRHAEPLWIFAPPRDGTSAFPLMCVQGPRPRIQGPCFFMRGGLETESDGWPTMSANAWDDEYRPDDDEFDGCEHGKGFDEHCQACEDDPLGCLYPGKCVMPGEHLISECCTAEMMEEINDQTDTGTGCRKEGTMKWISVTERLPEDDRPVLAARYGNGIQPWTEIASCYFAKDGTREWCGEVLFWHPLPTPPAIETQP